MPLKPYIKSHITRNTKTYCEVYSHTIFNEDVSEIVELLNQQSQVKSLTIGQTNIDDDGIILLNGLKHVTHLTLKRNNISDVGAIALVRNIQFKGLNFYSNFGISDLAGNVMANESQQTFLDVSNTSITIDCQARIAEKVAKNKTDASATASTQSSAPCTSRFFEEMQEGSNRFNDILQKALQDQSAIDIKIR